MSNPIDNNGPRLNGVAGAQPGQGPSGSKGVTAEQDKTEQPRLGAGEVGVQSERLQMIKERIDNTPEVDIERVRELKERIAEGRYPIDPQRIAEKFAQLEGLLHE